MKKMILSLLFIVSAFIIVPNLNAAEILDFNIKANVALEAGTAKSDIENKSNYVFEGTNATNLTISSVSLLQRDAADSSSASTDTNLKANVNNYELEFIVKTTTGNTFPDEETEDKINVTFKAGSKTLTMPSDKYASIPVGTEAVARVNVGVEGEGSARVRVFFKTESATTPVTKTKVTFDGLTFNDMDYTGKAYEYQGTLTTNPNVAASELEVTYKGDGYNSSKAPVNAGSYTYTVKVKDSNATYEGEKSWTFKINKVNDPSAKDITVALNGKTGDKLSTVTLPKGYTWVDGDTLITDGENNYPAVFTATNANYNNVNVQVKVLGEDLITIIKGDKVTTDLAKNTDYVIEVDEEKALFDALLIDGKEVNKSNYKVTEGSTIITLSSKYLNTLGKGDYKFEVRFTNNKSAKGSFTLIKTAASKNPNTSDNVSIYFVMFSISLLSVIVLLNFFKTKKRFN